MELTIEDLLRLIGQVGFPIVVATYLLIRNNGKMDKLKEAILELKEAITLLREELNR
ncbi:MAG: YvrJ family protein [Caldisericia bacterium]|nr:YvrJ family protein [Caldisericia bacterium]